MTLTPGPWKVKKTNYGGWVINPICDLYDDICQMHNGPLSNGDQKSNAQLIAAAPDLLEACKTLLTTVRIINVSPDDPVLDLVFKAFYKAEQAIVKAEGQPS